MNDFTKEELRQIHEACTYWFECPDDGIMEEAKPLLEKIYSMIDNYCEHNWHKGVNMCNDVYCPKCHKTLEVGNIEF